MSRIARAFEVARHERRKVLVTYLCGGDPSLESTARMVPALAEAGADIIEIGLPFSDPLADGPTIQAASQRALERGVTVAKILELVFTLRSNAVQVPIVLMGYFNPILAMGLERFCERAAAAGVDGLIVPDLPLEEHGPLGAAAAARGIDLVLLAAPTTPAGRLKDIAEASRGFLYLVSVAGVTGARASVPVDLPQRLDAARSASRLPVAVGFGISTPEQARELGAHADAVVVGSALVQRLHDALGDPGPALLLVRSLAAALRSPNP